MPLLEQLHLQAGVQLTREGLLHQVGWTSSFARPTSSLSTRSWMGDSNSSSPTPLAGPSKLLLPNPELTTVGHERICKKKRSSSIELRIELSQLRIELRSAEDRERDEDLGEPECYYFEEYEAPRMNPSVVAAHKRIGLLQKFNKWQGKAIEKMQKSMDKMVSKIKSLEKKVSGSSSKKKSKAPTFPRSRSLLTTQGGSLPKSLTEPLLSSQGKEKTTRREGGRLPRPDAPARPPDSIESKQRKLNSIELTVELTRRSPSSRIRDLNTIPCLTRSLPGVDGTPMDSTSYQGQGSHTHFNDEEEEEEEPQARSSEPQEATPVAWSAPDGRLPSPDHDLVSQFFGGH
ncbi:unnamed protein product [Microthlaspi erraticum]|uniref:Arabidopsis retrotransposon Orf1 C-terminal domain-containing protein n=1 Tax=Microthlaspi erraticum TaxID=1685480 RepID=A0A6D2JLT8_9BRAS|nr:unnamed protein product [Microthlaspi erraticum]